MLIWHNKRFIFIRIFQETKIAFKERVSVIHVAYVNPDFISKIMSSFFRQFFFKEISTINKGTYFSLKLLTNYYQHYSTLWSLVKFFFTAQIVYRFDEILMEFKHYFRTSISIMIWIWMETNDSNSVKMKLNHHIHTESEYYTTTLFFDEEKNI